MKGISFENGKYFPNLDIVNRSDDGKSLVLEFDLPSSRQFSDVERELRRNMNEALDRIEVVSETDNELNQSYYGYVKITEMTQLPPNTGETNRIRLSLEQPDLHELVTRVYMKLTQLKNDNGAVAASIGGVYADSSSDIMTLLSQVL